MLSNYFTLLHLSRELNTALQGAVVAEVYSQEKNTLSIVFYTPEPFTVTISCIARNNSIIARRGMMRAKQNSVDLFPALTDKHVDEIYVAISDRIVSIRFSENLWLAAEMFGARANVVLMDETGTILDAFLEKKEVVGAKRQMQKKFLSIAAENFLPPKDEFLSAMNAESTVSVILKKQSPKLGTAFVKEILCNAKIAGEKPASQLTTAERIALYNEIEKVIALLLQTRKTTPVIYFDDKTPISLSLIPLNHLSEYRREEYSDLFSAIQRFISFSRSSDSLHTQKNDLIYWLKKEIEKNNRTMEKIVQEVSVSSRGEQYELFAKLLMANLHRVKKGMKDVEVENIFFSQEMISIPLEQSLSPAQNAERYFDKAKKSKAAKEEAQTRLDFLRRQSEMLSPLLSAVEEIADSISLKSFLNSKNTQLHQLGYMTEKEQEELPPFKIFTVEGGFTVYAGKSSENNDLLTVKFAKPNDLWFHARGSSGSHVVLKIGTGNGEPSKKAIEQTASIAAYYSKMKNAKNVPVAMTEKKYVRKPKGVPAGTVVIEREKVIFVEPKLPG